MKAHAMNRAIAKRCGEGAILGSAVGTLTGYSN